MTLSRIDAVLARYCVKTDDVETALSEMVRAIARQTDTLRLDQARAIQRLDVLADAADDLRFGIARARHFLRSGERRAAPTADGTF